MQQTHHLKLDKYYWDAVKSGDKPFEVRRDDRGFLRSALTWNSISSPL